MWLYVVVNGKQNKKAASDWRSKGCVFRSVTLRQYSVAHFTQENNLALITTGCSGHVSYNQCVKSIHYQQRHKTSTQYDCIAYALCYIHSLSFLAICWKVKMSDTTICEVIRDSYVETWMSNEECHVKWTILLCLWQWYATPCTTAPTRHHTSFIKITESMPYLPQNRKWHRKRCLNTSSEISSRDLWTGQAATQKALNDNNKQ